MPSQFLIMEIIDQLELEVMVDCHQRQVQAQGRWLRGGRGEVGPELDVTIGVDESEDEGGEGDRQHLGRGVQAEGVVDGQQGDWEVEQPEGVVQCVSCCPNGCGS